jgi:hypothetical protein
MYLKQQCSLVVTYRHIDIKFTYNELKLNFEGIKSKYVHTDISAVLGIN